jgi:hypothetical protein
MKKTKNQAQIALIRILFALGGHSMAFAAPTPTKK